MCLQQLLNLHFHGNAKFRRHKFLHVLRFFKCLVLVNLQSYASISQVLHVDREHCPRRLLAVVLLSLLWGSIGVSFAAVWIIFIEWVLIDVLDLEVVDDFGLYLAAVIWVVVRNIDWHFDEVPVENVGLLLFFIGAWRLIFGLNEFAVIVDLEDGFRLYLRSAGIGFDTLSDVLLGDYSEAGPIRILQLVINLCLQAC